MNTGQMMITLAALVLLTVVILRVNTSFLSTNTIVQQTKYGVMAVSLGTSIIEEASDKAFDKITKGCLNNQYQLITEAASLGPESGEVYPNFDDFDDFNGYTRNTANDATFLSANFTATVIVNYITPTTPIRHLPPEHGIKDY